MISYMVRGKFRVLISEKNLVQTSSELYPNTDEINLSFIEKISTFSHENIGNLISLSKLVFHQSRVLYRAQSPYRAELGHD